MSMSHPFPSSSPAQYEAKAAQARISSLVSSIGTLILGKEHSIRLAITCLLARGHLLFQDLPGVGKTTLAQALARSLGLDFKRVQFTSDILPADITGTTIFEKDSGQFIFKPGPVFAHVLLADEINRATPKSQSALLEAMEEGQVTCDGTSHLLPEPFFVIATQNPSHQMGTFPLPESQMDRFLMRLELGLPHRAAEREMLLGADRRDMLRSLRPVLSPQDLTQLQQTARSIHLSPALVDYVQDLLAMSRSQSHGLSPRAGLALLSAAKAWALGQGRAHVLPEDVQAVAPAVFAHRLDNPAEGIQGSELTASILKETPVV
jgi:MoxR-like ATPase